MSARLASVPEGTLSPTLQRPGYLCPRCAAPLTADNACAGCRTAYREDDGILRLVTGRAGSAGFDPAYYERLASVEQRQFWFVARRELILDALRRQLPDLSERPLYDIGCGSGGLLWFLAESGVPIAGACDAYEEGLRFARRRVAAQLALIDEGSLPPLAPGQRLIGLFDVLEHLDDDAGTLNWLASVLEPGGVLVLTVPAHPFLFDEMDRLAFHRRRYTRRDLRAKLTAAGFRIRLLTHFMASLLPLLLASRMLGKLVPKRVASVSDRRGAELSVQPGLNALLLGLLRLERRLAGGRCLPFGSSILAIAETAAPANSTSEGTPSA